MLLIKTINCMGLVWMIPLKAYPAKPCRASIWGQTFHSHRSNSSFFYLIYLHFHCIFYLSYYRSSVLFLLTPSRPIIAFQLPNFSLFPRYNHFLFSSDSIFSWTVDISVHVWHGLEFFNILYCPMFSYWVHSLMGNGK